MTGRQPLRLVIEWRDKNVGKRSLRLYQNVFFSSLGNEKSKHFKEVSRSDDHFEEHSACGLDSRLAKGDSRSRQTWEEWMLCWHAALVSQVKDNDRDVVVKIWGSGRRQVKRIGWERPVTWQMGMSYQDGIIVRTEYSTNLEMRSHGEERCLVMNRSPWLL